MKLKERSICWICYLPTVSSRTPRGGHSLNTLQGVNVHPGGRDHRHTECPTPHLIRPGLYALWERGLAELKAYVTRKINIERNLLKEYIDLVQGVDRWTKLANHILLFWWICKLKDTIR